MPFMPIQCIEILIWQCFLVQSLVRRWAPLVFLAPGEKFYPSDVSEFLANTIAIPKMGTSDGAYENFNATTEAYDSDDLPKGRTSESWFLTTREDVEDLLKNSSSFIYGQNPKKFSVPVYALIEVCQPETKPYENKSDITTLEIDESKIKRNSSLHFHVTYWMFYPFSQGKSLCTFDMGRFGAWPIPKLNNHCLGHVKEFGNHVGDWEHISLYFEESEFPQKIYVSAHDVGAFYKYSELYKQYEFEKREIRKGILQRPIFPRVMKLATRGRRPVLFSARGSHGLWTAPGKHRFVRLPRLHDDSGFGVPWMTWKNVRMLKAHSQTPRNWLKFRGKWGNQKSRCHPVSRFGINFCEILDGPTGIPLKKMNFQCTTARQRQQSGT